MERYRDLEREEEEEGEEEEEEDEMQEPMLVGGRMPFLAGKGGGGFLEGDQ